MGYETNLYLIDVKIKPKSVPLVSRALKTMKARGLIRLEYFLELAVIDRAGCLAFKASEDGLGYVPDEDGTVPALTGKWYEAERIARWLRHHSEAGGRMILHSYEGDGAAWGWEFDGKGQMRPWELVPVGKWE